MFRKISVVTSIVVIITLLLSSQAVASGKDSKPAWTTAFDPAGIWPYPYHFIAALEQFKNNLYVAVSVFYQDEPSAPVAGGQIFRSADGKHWAPVTDPGFGLAGVDTGCWNNGYDNSWDMTVYRDQLYVGVMDTCYQNPGVIMRSRDGVHWQKVMAAGDIGLTYWVDGVQYYAQPHKFGVYKGWLYADVDYYDPQADFTVSAVIRSPNGAPGTWEIVKNFPGWGWPGSFYVFKGALYLVSDAVYTPPDYVPALEQMWRTYDGQNWEQVAKDGFGTPGAYGIGGMMAYKGYLYVGTRSDLPDVGVGQIWRSKNGSVWEPVITDGFGNPKNVKVDGLMAYKGRLLAYTVNWTEGASVYSTKDTKHWEAINEPGWGNPEYWATHLASDQVIFKDTLYMGVYGPHGVVLKLLHP